MMATTGLSRSSSRTARTWSERRTFTSRGYHEKSARCSEFSWMQRRLPGTAGVALLLVRLRSGSGAHLNVALAAEAHVEGEGVELHGLAADHEIEGADLLRHIGEVEGAVVVDGVAVDRGVAAQDHLGVARCEVADDATAENGDLEQLQVNGRRRCATDDRSAHRVALAVGAAGLDFVVAGRQRREREAA